MYIKKIGLFTNVTCNIHTKCYTVILTKCQLNPPFLPLPQLGLARAESLGEEYTRITQNAELLNPVQLADVAKVLEEIIDFAPDNAEVR